MVSRREGKTEGQALFGDVRVTLGKPCHSTRRVRLSLVIASHVETGAVVRTLTHELPRIEDCIACLIWSMPIWLSESAEDSGVMVSAWTVELSSEESCR